MSNEPENTEQTPAERALEFFDWFTEAVKTNPPKSEDVYPPNRYSGD